LQDLGNGGLLSQRFVTFGGTRGELLPKRGYGFAGIDLCVVGHRLGPLSGQQQCGA
jgi:hypothetical protein